MFLMKVLSYIFFLKFLSHYLLFYNTLSVVFWQSHRMAFC